MTSSNPKPGVAVGAALSFPPHGNAVDSVIASAQTAAAAGLSGIWLGQRFDYDAISLSALIGREVPELTVGSSAVPIFGRQPLLIAAQAQTAQAATRGRFQLGLALGAAALTEKAFGVSFTRPVRRLDEFLTALREALTTGLVDFHGTDISTTSPFPSLLPGADPVPPILVAALGPKALAVAGRRADGILPFLAAPEVLERHIVPALADAARQAGRPTPRVIAFVPTLVTDDAEQARGVLADASELYNTIPSYRRVLDLAGVRSAAEVGVIGSARQVRAGLQDYLNAGATEVVVTQTDLLGAAAQRRTWDAVAQLR